MQKRVRFRNSTTDGTSIRVYVVHADPGICAVFHAAAGETDENNNMTPGSRGVVVYNADTGQAIATGIFNLSTFNVTALVNGNALDGYGLYFEAVSD